MRGRNTIQSPAPNVPKKLWNIYKKRFNGNCYRVAKFLEVNPAYVWNLLKKGVEPTDRTVEGQRVRKKLFLPKSKNRNTSLRKQLPDYIKQWNKLSTEERRRAIQEYITWRNKNEQKQNEVALRDG